MAGARQALLIALVVAAGYFGRELRLVVFEQRQSSLRHEDIYYLPPAQWLPVMSAGFHSALADLIWCRSLVYFGEELQQKSAIRHVFDYTDAVLALDPDFRSAYTWITTAALYKPQEASIDDGLKALEYLERATKRWPNDGELHWRYGSVLRFELAPYLPPGPKKEQSHRAGSAAPGDRSESGRRAAVAGPEQRRAARNAWARPSRPSATWKRCTARSRTT